MAAIFSLHENTELGRQRRRSVFNVIWFLQDLFLDRNHSITIQEPNRVDI